MFYIKKKKKRLLVNNYKKVQTFPYGGVIAKINHLLIC